MKNIYIWIFPPRSHSLCVLLYFKCQNVQNITSYTLKLLNVNKKTSKHWGDYILTFLTREPFLKNQKTNVIFGKKLESETCISEKRNT